MTDLIKLEFEDKFAILSFNNPPVNALSLQVWKRLLQILNELESNRAILGLLITSNLSKPLFTAGNDLMSLYAPASSKQKFRDFWLTQTEFLSRLYSSHLLTIACINGHSPAGGCGIALCCDYRIMTDSESSKGARIGLNEVSIGIIVPKFWAQLMLKTVGNAGKVEKWLMNGMLISPEEALKARMIDEIVPRNIVLTTGINRMREMLKISPTGRQLTKKLLREEFANEWYKYGEEEARMAWEVLSSEPVVKKLGSVLKNMKKSKI